MMKRMLLIGCCLIAVLLGKVTQVKSKAVVVPLSYGLQVISLNESTVTSATGRVWMDRNLGAARVAQVIDDAQAYGDLYQWGRGSDGHEQRGSSTITELSLTDQPGHGDFIITSALPNDWRDGQNVNLWKVLNPINNPCPAGFYVPTKKEWQAEAAQYGADLFNSPLKLPVAGIRSSDGSLSYEGSRGYYWSSTVADTGYGSLYQYIGEFAIIGNQLDRASGLSVRCIQKVPTVTTATGRVWMDRNLGAARVATSIGDTEGYGDLYQWGRLSDGHEQRSSSTTLESSTDDVPGHGDFITTDVTPYDWRSTQNDALWQGLDGTNNPCPAGFRLPTQAEWQAEASKYGSTGTGLYDSPLKLPAAGVRNYASGTFSNEGSHGCYWSSSVAGPHAFLLIFSTDATVIDDGRRATGNSVRCIQE